MGVFTDASLALLAFVFVLWVTIPWAFLDMVNKNIESAKSELQKHISENKPIPLDEIKDVEKPKTWLVYATNAFLYSGILFLVQVLLDYANILYLPFPLFFIGGIGFTFWGIFETYRVIQFLLNPERTPEIYGIVTTARIFAIVLASFYFYIFCDQIYYGIYRDSVGNEIITLSFFIASITMTPLVFKIKARDRFVWRRFILFLICSSLPLVMIFLLILYYVATGARIAT